MKRGFVFVGLIVASCGEDDFVEASFEDGVALCSEIEAATGERCIDNPDDCIKIRCQSDLIGYICHREIYEAVVFTTVDVLSSFEAVCENNCNHWDVLDCSDTTIGLDYNGDYYDVACDHHCSREK